MVDLLTVCCMCGDVGFPEKLFRCNKCRSRFQHSYCSNYHDEASIAGLCDWCQSEERNLMRQGALQSQSKRSGGKSNGGVFYRSAYSGDEIKQTSYKEEGSSSERRKNINSSPSPRPSGRRYKLLKDVLC